MESGLSDDKQCQVEITRRGGEASIPPLALIFFGRLKFFFVMNKFQLKMLHCFVQAVVASYRIEKMYAYAFTLIKKRQKRLKTTLNLCLEASGSETLSGQVVYI